MNTHTRKEAIGQKQSAARKEDGRSLDTDKGKMPMSQATTPKQESPLSVGDSSAGLGPMPWRKNPR